MKFKLKMDVTNKSKALTFFLIKVICLSILAGVFVYCFFLIDRKFLEKADFISFITGAKLVLSHVRNNFYDVQTQLFFQKTYVSDIGGLLPFRYLPTVALVFIPFSFFQMAVSYKLFFIVNLLLLFLCIASFSQIFKKLNIIVVGSTALMFIPSLYVLITGQVSFIFLLIWLAAYKSIRDRESLTLGFIVSLFATKLSFLVCIPFIFLLVRKKSKFFLGFSAASALSIGISLLFIGKNGLFAYPKFLAETETLVFGSDQTSQTSLFSAIIYGANLVVKKSISADVIYLTLFIVFLTTIYIFNKKYKRLGLKRNFSIISLLIPALAPHFWDFDLVLTLFPILYILESIAKGRLNKRLWAALFCVLFFSYLLRFLGYPFMISIVLVVSSLMLMFNPGRY